MFVVCELKRGGSFWAPAFCLANQMSLILQQQRQQPIGISCARTLETWRCAQAVLAEEKQCCKFEPSQDFPSFSFQMIPYIHTKGVKINLRCNYALYLMKGRHMCEEEFNAIPVMTLTLNLSSKRRTVYILRTLLCVRGLMWLYIHHHVCGLLINQFEDKC